MCGGGGGLGDFLKKSYDTAFGGLPSRLGVVDDGGPLGVAKRSLSVLKPPSLDVNFEAAAAAGQQHKLLQAAAFGLSDTKLTGGKGLGSVPQSLLFPKTTIGG